MEQAYRNLLGRPSTCAVGHAVLLGVALLALIGSESCAVVAEPDDQATAVSPSPDRSPNTRRQQELLERCFMESACFAHDISPLWRGCTGTDRGEKRFWLMGNRGPRYLLRILGRTPTQPPDGEFLAFAETQLQTDVTPRRALYCDEIGADIVSEVRPIHDEVDFNWDAVIHTLTMWDELDERYVIKGSQSSLRLLVESCHGGVYELESFRDQDTSDEVIQVVVPTLAGLILSWDPTQSFDRELDP